MAVDFPCDPWTRLASLWPAETAKRKIEEGNETLRCVRRLVASRLKKEWHVWLENPLLSRCMADTMLDTGSPGFVFREFQDRHVHTDTATRETK